MTFSTQLSGGLDVFQTSRGFRRSTPTRCSRISASASEKTTTTRRVPVKDIGGFSVLGTSRKANEDRFDYQVLEEVPDYGSVNTFVGVYDGHGGSSVATWLEQRLSKMIGNFWEESPPEAAIRKAFIQADIKLLQPPGGFFGAFGERGVGGSKCGATGAVAAIYEDKEEGRKVLAANVGDSRVVLIRNGQALQLTEDHVPDVEEERLRIEAQNPNPKMALVRYVGGTWRVGGILALSRAFGDAYLKGSLQFEGIDSGTAYESGFGVIADPYVSVTNLEEGDSWLIVHSDGLNSTVARGGGGGIENDELAAICQKSGDVSSEDLAEKLCIAAQENGSTDDVTTICVKLDL
ncbi:hypothetical protein BSKO_07952 [Bryopsis sp. KO-2023]|nr:hypothetical protein BSKO_07952 [Bryopsis sp. KO-2023]